MSTTETIQNYTVQPVLSPVVPVPSANTLADTFNVDPSYSTSTGQLTVLMSFMIPSTLSPSQVSIKQYYNPSEPSRIEFYAAYSSESTGSYKQVNCKFKASPVDATGAAITLGAILNVYTMVYCSVGPKTSRGATTSVRVTGS